MSTLGTAPFAYEWIDHWAWIPDTPSGRNSGRTHGIGCTRDARVVVFHQAQPAILIYDTDGNLLDALGDRFCGAHGLTLQHDAHDEPFLWLTDEISCEVCKVNLAGETLQRLAPPPVADRDGKFKPTWAAQHPETGETWVADGYGSWYVFRYAEDGTYLGRLTGEEGAGRFREPHGLNIAPDGEVWITDRAAHQVVVYDAAGAFLRAKKDECHSPCCFDFFEGHAFVPELFTGVKVLDRELNAVASIGAHPDVGPKPDGGWWPPRAPQGWPNLHGTEHVRPEHFVAPHGLAVDPSTGDVYVGEWMVGGRLTKLRRV